MSLRALTLVDVLAQLNTDSAADIPFDANIVINALVSDEETLNLDDTSTATTVTNYPIALIEDVGPIGYWRLDDPVSATSVCDSSPWASSTWPKVPGVPHGTITWQTAGAMNGSKGATFDGSTAYVEVANTASLQRVGDLTIELWLKPTSVAAARTLISKGATGEYHVVLNSGGAVTLQMGPAYSQVVVPAATITAGAWWHLVITRRAIDKSVCAYVNGVSTYSSGAGGYSVAPSTTTNVLRIGAASPTVGSFFPGALDEVVLYARPLSAAQVAAHYAWATASDCGSTPYGTARYGYTQYPTPGPATGAIYGDPSTVYGSATYA